MLRRWLADRESRGFDSLIMRDGRLNLEGFKQHARVGCAAIPRVKHPTTHSLASSTEESLEAFAETFRRQFSGAHRPGATSDLTQAAAELMNILQQPSSEEEAAAVLEPTEVEVREALKALKLGKAPGPGNIPATVLKLATPTLVQVLTRLFSAMLRVNHTPGWWKKAYLTPIYKHGDRTCCENFRPISVTPTIAKVWEHVVRSRLISALPHGISRHQAAYQRGRRITEATASIIMRVQEAFRAQGVLPVAFLDLVKAFDMVPHDLLLLKLQRLGTPVHLLRTVRSIISGRSFQVRLGRFLSAEKRIMAGLQQGGLIIPFIFALWVSDLSEDIASQGALPVSVSDDTAIIPALCATTEATYQSLQRGLDAAQKWSEKWCSPLSASKSVVVVFSKREDLDPSTLPSARLGDRPVTVVPTKKHLGVVLDSQLTFASQLSHLDLKLSRQVSLIRKVMLSCRSPPPARALLAAISAVLHGTVAYALNLWSPLDEQLIRLQRHVASFLIHWLRLPRNGISTTAICHEAGVMPFAFLRDLEIVKFGRYLLSRPDIPCSELFRQGLLGPFGPKLALDYVRVCRSWGLDPLVPNIPEAEMKLACDEQHSYIASAKSSRYAGPFGMPSGRSNRHDIFW